MNKTFKLSQAIITKDGGNIILTFPTNVKFVEHAIRVTDPGIFGDPVDIYFSEITISTRWEGFYHTQTPEGGDVFTFTEDQFKDFILNEVLNKVEDKYPEYQGFTYHNTYKVEINIDYIHIKRVA